MNALELLRSQFEQTHQFLEMTVAGCTPDVLSYRAPGSTINSIGGIYAHIALAEDSMVNGMVRGGQTVVSQNGWAAKLAIQEPGPFQTPAFADMTIDLPVFQEYAAVVARSVGEFLAGASETDIEGSVDTPNGSMPKLAFLWNISATHVPAHWGEIAALKGVQGLKGLPF